ncbi:MAG: thioredoxin family protein [Methylocystaceae bacterium]
MEIKVLGTGAQCKQLEKEVFKAVADMEIAANVEKVGDLKRIMAYKVMSTPALVVNGKVKVAGRVPKPEEIKKYIKAEL